MAIILQSADDHLAYAMGQSALSQARLLAQADGLRAKVVELEAKLRMRAPKAVAPGSAKKKQSDGGSQAIGGGKGRTRDGKGPRSVSRPARPTS